MAGGTRQLERVGHSREHVVGRLRPLLAAALALLLGLGLGCGSDSTSEGGESTSLDCEALAAAATSGVPLTRVALTGLVGADTDEDWVRVEAEGYPAYPTALYGDEVDGFEVLVPPHPDGPDGGALRLLVTDGGASCPAIAFDVLPLPAHAGDPIGELAAALDEIAEAFADRYDVDPADLFATPLDELPPELIPLAVLFEGLDAVDLAAELAALDPDEVELLQDLLGVIDLAPLLEDFADEIAALPLSLPAMPASAASADPASPLAALAGRTPLELAMAPALAVRAATAPQAANGADCTDLGSVPKSVYDLSTPEKLADYIEASRGAADAIGPLRSGISDYNSGFVLLGLVPGTGWYGFAVGQIWGWGGYLVDLAQQMRANLYPSEITRLTFQVDETAIPEDWDTANDGKIKWSFAKLYASNKGMNIARVIVDGALNVVSSTAALGGAKGFLSTAEGLGVGVTDALGRPAINSRLDELQEDDETVECWNIGVTEFGPVVVPDDSGDKWVSARVTDGESITLDDREITPTMIGASTLRIETNTDNLPGIRAFEDRQIEVRRKSVKWLPAVLMVEKTDQEETVRVRFDDTKHYEEDKIEFEPDPLITGLTKTSLGNGLYEVKFKTPKDKEDFPLRIIARSTSAELPPDAPAREGEILITTKEAITISPRNECVPFGQTLDLTAEVAAATDAYTVEWEIVSGSGDLEVSGPNGENAKYKALGSGSGQVTIRAKLAGDDAVDDEVTLSHGSCVSLAVFYEFDGSYIVPGAEPGCSVYEGGGEFEIRNDNEDNDGKNPEIPLTPGELWGPGQTFSIAEFDGTPGQRGNGSPESCATGTFPAEYSNTSEIAIGESGDLVAYDIELIASATCDTFSDGAEACSGAATFSGIWAVYDLEVDAAATYRLEVDMACSTTIPLPVLIDNITAGFLRFDSGGNPVPTHQDFGKAKFIETASCYPGGTGTIDVTFEVDAPLATGTTDRLTVYVVTAIGATALPEEGEDDDSASLIGTIQLRQVAN